MIVFKRFRWIQEQGPSHHISNNKILALTRVCPWMTTNTPAQAAQTNSGLARSPWLRRCRSPQVSPQPWALSLALPRRPAPARWQGMRSPHPSLGPSCTAWREAVLLPEESSAITKCSWNLKLWKPVAPPLNYSGVVFCWKQLCFSSSPTADAHANTLPYPHTLLSWSSQQDFSTASPSLRRLLQDEDLFELAIYSGGPIFQESRRTEGEISFPPILSLSHWAPWEQLGLPISFIVFWDRWHHKSTIHVSSFFQNEIALLTRECM